MSLLDFNTNPSDRQLRQFGAVCVIAVPLAAWLWTDHTVTVVWASGAGLLLCGLGCVAPRLLQPVFVGLTILTIPIGLIVGELAMLGIYFGLFLPMGILFRIIGRDSLQRRSQTDSGTYWQKRIPPSSVRRYYQQS